MSGQAAVAFTVEPRGPVRRRRERRSVFRSSSSSSLRRPNTRKEDQIRDQLLQQKQQERFGLFVSNVVDQMTKFHNINSMPLEQEVRVVAADYLEAMSLGLSRFLHTPYYAVSSMRSARRASQWPLSFFRRRSRFLRTISLFTETGVFRIRWCRGGLRSCNHLLAYFFHRLWYCLET